MYVLRNNNYTSLFIFSYASQQFTNYIDQGIDIIKSNIHSKNILKIDFEAKKLNHGDLEKDIKQIMMM